MSEGDVVSVRGGSVFRNGDCLASGRTLARDELARALAEQRGRVTQALEEFAENTMRHLRDEGSVLAGAVEFPPLHTSFRDRHALVVARGPGMKRDLASSAATSAIQAGLVAVDGGADALLELGKKPDVIVGDMDSVSDEALRSGAELVVHAYTGNGNAPGAPRLDKLGLPYHSVRAGDQRGPRAAARVRERRRADRRRRDAPEPDRVPRARARRDVVDVRDAAEGRGDPRRREGRVAPREPARRRWPLVVFALAGFGAIVTAVLVSPQLRHVINLVSLRIQDLLGL